MAKEDALRILRPLALLLLALATLWAVLLAGQEEWQLGLLIFFTGAAIFAERFVIETDDAALTGSFVAIILALVLLGPVQAAIASVLATLAAYIRFRNWKTLACDLPTFALFPLIAGTAGLLVEPLVNGPGGLALYAAGIYGFALITQFVLNSLLIGIIDGEPVIEKLRKHLFPMASAEFACAGLTAVAVVLYDAVGSTALVIIVLTLLMFQWLTAELVRSQQRARHLAVVSRRQVVIAIRALAARDEATARHSAAVAFYVYALAHQIELEPEECARLRMAAVLHDIGKLQVPDQILRKPGRLTESEYMVIKRHPYQGAKLIATIDGYEDLAEIVVAHHERIDGCGYPRGMADEQIPLGAKLIAIADTYDVITARTVYREPSSHEDAVEELHRVAGTQLDATLVDQFIKALDASGLRFGHIGIKDFNDLLDDLVAEQPTTKIGWIGRLRRHRSGQTAAPDDPATSPSDVAA